MRALLSGCLALVVLTGCDEETRSGFDPNYRDPVINGILYRVEFYDGSVEYLRDVEVLDNDGFRMVPTVSLNGAELTPYSYSTTAYRYGNEAWFRVFRPYELTVNHYWGTAFSRVVMPGNFELTAPPDEYILSMESTMVITWRPSAGAQWYWLDLYCDYDFVDTSEQWDDYSFNLDTVVHDTFVVVTPGMVFPSHVLEVLEGDGSALVLAGYGPEVEPGDVGNVRGAGFGFVTAGNEPAEKYFYVGAPPRAAGAGTPRVRREKLARRLARRERGRPR